MVCTDGLPDRPSSTKELLDSSANRLQHRARPIPVSNWRWREHGEQPHKLRLLANEAPWLRVYHVRSWPADHIRTRSFEVIADIKT